jgi:hypothetical protein
LGQINSVFNIKSKTAQKRKKKNNAAKIEIFCPQKVLQPMTFNVKLIVESLKITGKGWIFYASGCIFLFPQKNAIWADL